jgi:hypothetical protein
MSKAEAIILLVLCLFLGGCLKIADGKYPKPRNVPKAESKGKGKTLYRSVVPGMPMPGGYVVGGVYVSEEVAKSVFEKIQSFLLVVAAICFVGFLIGCVMMYYGRPTGLDLITLGGSFSVLSALAAVWAKVALISLGIACIVVGGYFLFVLWRKESDENIQRVLVDNHDDPEKRLEDLNVGSLARKKIFKLKVRNLS